MADTKWGILATGGIAQAFTRDIQGAGLEVTAVGSRTTESAEQFAQQFNIPRAHGTYQDLATDPNVDVIYIATPHPQHVEAALLALRNGKHVLIEKPITLNAQEAALIQREARDRGLLAMEAMWTRYLPHMVRIRQLIAEGALGDIRMVIADHTQLAPADPKHRMTNLELGGGALLDLGIYPISLVRDILGAPTSVVARGQLGPTGADSDVAIILTHQDGALGSIATSLAGAGPNTAHIIGSKARVDIDRVWYTATDFTLTASDGTVLERYESSVQGRGMQYQALYLEELLASGKRDSELQPLTQSVEIMETLDQIRQQIGLVYPGEAPA